MTRSGRVDYDQVARAQALLLRQREMTPMAQISAYRTVRTVTPNAYTDQFVRALVAQARLLGGDAGLPLLTEAADLARQAAAGHPRHLPVLAEALDGLQHAHYAAGRRAEGLAVCREAALAAERAIEGGLQIRPRYDGLWTLAGRLAEEGSHAEAAELFERAAHDDASPWSHDAIRADLAWIAELEASGDHAAARTALRALIDDTLLRPGRDGRPHFRVLWELLLLAALDREQGRVADAELCDAEIEALLVSFSADSEVQNVGWYDMSVWTILIGLTGRRLDRPAPGRPEPPLFLHPSDWSPDLLSDHIGAGYDRLEAEVARLTTLAAEDPSAHLGRLIEAHRAFTLRTVRHVADRLWRVVEPLPERFDRGVSLGRAACELDGQPGRAALAQALIDRSSLRIAGHDFPRALADFRQARRVAAGGPLD